MLKKILIFFVLFAAFLSNNTQAQNPQLTFDRANQQLEKGDIRGALALYQSLQTQNHVSGALFLNMGLSYIKVDSMGKAKYYFLKARQFDETEEEAAKGLRYVETRFSHQSAVLPVLPWQKALNWLNDEIGSVALLAIGLIFFNIGVFLFIGNWFVKQPGKFWARGALVTAALGSLIILLSFYTHYRQQRYSKAVMITREANVKEQPDSEAPMVNQAFEGYTFTVDHTQSSENPNWSYIRMSNGLYGWIATKEIMIL